jgi:4-amino-4-deoxy-L-arabinose transferase-like glycosyltransferase
VGAAAEHGGGPAHKPPLYNWIGWPLLKAGFWSEPALKMPSLLAGAVTLVVTVMMGAYLARRGRQDPEGGLDPSIAALTFGLVCGIIWLTNHAGFKLFYLARPDMLLVACVVVSWAAGTVLLLEESLSTTRRVLLQLALWLGVVGAGLSKGPPALLPIIYVVIGAKLLTGRWRAVGRTGIVWGLPLAVVLSGLWIRAAMAADAEVFEKQLIGDQVLGRIERGGAYRIITEFWKSPGFFIVRMLPWSLIAILTYLHIRPRRWFAHAMGPAMLWTLIVVCFFMLAAGKRGDFLAPANISGAILAAYWLLVVARKYAVRPVHVAAAGVGIAIGLAVYHMQFSPAARSHLGEYTKEFAAQAMEMVGDEPVAFIETGANPLQTLMHRMQASRRPDDLQLAIASWILKPLDMDPVEAGLGGRVLELRLASKPLPEVDPKTGGAKPVGLYRVTGSDR